VALLGGIEFGGTKTVCVVGEEPGVILAESRFPTGDQPAVNLAACIDFFKSQGEVVAIGAGGFGPLDPNPKSPTFGYVTTTPKPGWANVPVVPTLKAGLGDIPIGFDTDVNVAALGELVHGAGRGLDSLVYLTIGTGVGGGAVVGGQLVHGLVHPEMGHFHLPRPASELAAFPGVCPYHGDCLEGVAAGPALAARWGSPAQDIGPDDERYEPMWELEAQYIADALQALVCILSPQKIVIGGGVGQQEQLLERLRPRLVTGLAGYVDNPAILENIDTYVVGPGLGNQAGGVGALELAKRCLG
jgi:fructokinase